MMRAQQLLLLAGTAHAFVVQPTAAPEKRQIDLDSECAEVAMELAPAVADLPLVDQSLIDFVAEQTHFLTLSDECVIPTATGSLSAEYTSWASDLSSWYDDHSDDLGRLLEACTDIPEVASLTSAFPGFASTCSEVTWETGSANSDNNDDDDNNDDGDNNNDDDNSNDNNDNNDDDNNNDSNDGSENSSNDDNEDAATGLERSGMTMAAALLVGLVAARVF